MGVVRANTPGHFCFFCLVDKDVFRGVNRNALSADSLRVLGDACDDHNIVLASAGLRMDGKDPTAFTRRTSELARGASGFYSTSHLSALASDSASGEKLGQCAEPLFPPWFDFMHNSVLDLLHFDLRTGDAIFKAPLKAFSDIKSYFQTLKAGLCVPTHRLSYRCVSRRSRV